jgi:hypothetical protein
MLKTIVITSGDVHAAQMHQLLIIWARIWCYSSWRNHRVITTS